MRRRVDQHLSKRQADIVLVPIDISSNSIISITLWMDTHAANAAPTGKLRGLEFQSELSDSFRHLKR